MDNQTNNFIISGAGGQGVLSLGIALANIFMENGKFVSFCPNYGAEVRGGDVTCEINISDTEVLCPQNNFADYVIALTQASFNKFISKVKENGTIIVNSSMAQIEKTRDDIKYIFVPLTQEAVKLGNIKTANSMALGVLSKILNNFTLDDVKKVYEKLLKNKADLVQKNLDAYLIGYNYTQKEPA